MDTRKKIYRWMVMPAASASCPSFRPDKGPFSRRARPTAGEWAGDGGEDCTGGCFRRCPVPGSGL